MAELIPVEQSQKSKDSMALIDSAIEASTRATNKFVSGIEKNVEDITSVTSETTKAAKSSAQSQAIIEGQKAIATLDATKRLRENFTVAAGGVGGLLQLGREFKDATDDILELGQEVEELQAHEFTGIIDFFSTELTLGFRERELDAARTRGQNIGNIISSISNNNTAVAKTLNQIAFTRTDATVAEEQNVIAQFAIIKAGTAELKSLASNAINLEAVYKANADRLRNAALGNAALNQVEAMEQRRIEHNLNVERLRKSNDKLDKDLELAKVRLAQAQETLRTTTSPGGNLANEARNIITLKEAELNFERAEENIRQRIAGVQRGQTLIGLEPETPERILAGISDPNTTKKYSDLFLIGAEGSDILGLTVDETVRVLGTHNPDFLRDSENPAVKLVNRIIANIDADLAADPGLKLNSQQLAARINDDTRIALETFASDIRVEEEANNPYQIVPFTEVEKSPAVQETTFYQKVLKDLQLKVTDAKQLMELATESIKEKEITIQQAVTGIQTIYDFGISNNNERHMFDRFGMPVQDSYFIKLPWGGSEFGFGFNSTLKPINLIDETDIRNWLINEIVSSATLPEEFEFVRTLKPRQ